MQDFNVRGLSALVIARKVEQRFGLEGFARLVKLLELIAESPTPTPEQPFHLLHWADVLEGLLANQATALELIGYCENARALRITQQDGFIEVVMGDELAGLMSPAPVAVANVLLFQKESQWAEWFATDLNCPPHLVKDPYTLKTFRRWCATNVTVIEVEAAIELAVKDHKAPSPEVLHDFLKIVRKTKIEQACQ